MHKSLSVIYIIFILIFGWYGFQLYVDRGAGLATYENLLIAIIFLTGMAIIGYSHNIASRSVSSTTHIMFATISTINAILTICLILLFSFTSNNGDMVSLLVGMLMFITLFVTFVLSIITLIRRGE